jgi:glycosyltransferase involved in cell wall biosynthesis
VRSADAAGLPFNAAYSGYPIGTGTWTQCLAHSSNQFDLIGARFDPTRQTRLAFGRKILWEAAFRKHKGSLRIHPYAACALDRRAALVILDTIGAADGSGWHAALLRRSIHMAATVATISRYQQTLLEIAHSRAFAVLTPYPHSDFFTLPTIRAPNAGPLRLSYWGGWHPRKGIVDLIMRLEPTGRVEFLVVGSPPPEIAERPDVTSYPELSRRELISLIDSSDAALYPSRDEGFGLPPYEALLRGRPAIIRALPCYKDYLWNAAPPGVYIIDDETDVGHIIRQVRVQADLPIRNQLRTPTLDAATGGLRDQVTRWLDADL